MVIYICPDCDKEFNRKSNYDNHTINKKKPCNKSHFIVPPKSSNPPPKSSILPPESSNFDSKIEDIIDIIVKKPETIGNGSVCTYCEKSFTRIDNLQRHLNGRCKSKENYDELDKLKYDMKLIIQNYHDLENNYQILLNEQKNKPKIIVNEDNIKTINNTINNNQINKGVILNNTVNIQVVQFGNEDIDKLNLAEGINAYLKSTGGNIVSNMIKYINLNEKYPENNNICMTDMSREIVKIHNGKKFVYKKFKNVKEDILNKIVKNTRKIVNRYENDEKIKKSDDTKSKLEINNVSLKIIDGVSAEDIVREEINEKEKYLIRKNTKKYIINNDENCDYDSDPDVEREFTLEERIRIEHLENKRDGMQKKTFENIKDELYNAKQLLENIN